MGFFSGLFRSRDKPQNRPTGSAYSFFFGGSSSGKRVNERSAMQMTAVYSCVRILAEAVAGLPLHLYRYKEDMGRQTDPVTEPSAEPHAGSRRGQNHCESRRLRYPTAAL